MNQAYAVSLDWGGDWILDPVSGKLTLSTGFEMMRQFILRRLLTNPKKNPVSQVVTIPDYLFHPEYGLGIGTYVGERVTQKFMTDLSQSIIEGIRSEPGVLTSPPPQVQITSSPSGLVQIFAVFYSTLGVQSVIGLQMQG